MAHGPGIYDDLCTHVREAANAQGVIVIVINGDKGSAFSAQADFVTQMRMADMLEAVARQMRETHH